MEQEKINQIITDLGFSSDLDAETASLVIALQLIEALPPNYPAGMEDIEIAKDLASKIGIMARSISPVRFNK